MAVGKGTGALMNTMPLQSRIERRPACLYDVPRLSIEDAFIRGNPRIEILSGGGVPTPIPDSWRPVLRESDVLVAVPDMHMFLYPSELDNFKFGAESMLDFLMHADSCRRVLAGAGARLTMYQLGDMYELWFPHPRLRKKLSVRDIRASHPIYDEIIRRFCELEFRHIIGNHDAEHRQPRRGLYAAFDGTVYLEHGYAADQWYCFSNPNHRHWRSSMKVLRAFRRTEAGLHRLKRRRDQWDTLCHSAFGIDSGDCERPDMPHPNGYPVRQLRYFDRLVRNSAIPPRICVIAHTHYPYLDPNFADGECMYADAGAWTEGRSDFVVITNSEIAVCRYRRTARTARAARTAAVPVLRTAG